MNVYDFDGTIYDGDSSVDFYRSCLVSEPKCALALPGTALGLLLFLSGRMGKTEWKARFFSFLRYVKDVDRAVLVFWRFHERKLKPWYLSQKQAADIVISASPEFLLDPICRKLGVTLVGSRVDKLSGKFYGMNCHGEEKARRLAEVTDMLAVEAFYSDSMADRPLLDAVARSFLVRKNRVTPWSGERLIRERGRGSL
jgi:phosphoserine phosphatase